MGELVLIGVTGKWSSLSIRDVSVRNCLDVV